MNNFIIVKAIPFLTIDPGPGLLKENQDLKVVQAEEITQLKRQIQDMELRLDKSVRLSKTLLEDFECYTKTGHHKPGIIYDFR